MWRLTNIDKWITDNNKLFIDIGNAHAPIGQIKSDQ